MVKWEPSDDRIQHESNCVLGIHNGPCLPGKAVYVEPALKDSGERTVFSTGAQRDRQFGKGKPSLVPNWIVWLVSRVYEDGALKYESRNWEKGMALSQYIDSAERHLAKLKCGLRDEPHASQVIWNIIGYIFTATLIKMGKRPAELNDMPDQLNADAAAKAEPLSPYEYSSLESFFGVKFVEKGAQTPES